MNGRNAGRRLRQIAVLMSPTERNTLMPKAEGPVYREILHASGKVDGKAARWIVGVFTNEKTLKAFAAHLNLARKAGMTDTVAAMDVHAPTPKDGQELTEVKLSRQTVQYNPQAPGLEDDAALV